ncbi:hypothetical protein K2173_023375 [Erythroxylum novogranatense]|uniref:Polymerase nucleotidyl transferase domain-containing protein n=1 Tax=Erythroxylum novogranatense TaxID=1862640 RepID=A0AAV8TXZ1_9ROSI|nr:hypothetical protein K2173_023375 [Erythroxylum novogranatense]
MGDLQRNLSPSNLSSSLFDLHRLSVDSELWMMAEQRILEVLYVIEPVFASDQRRREVIEYLQKLIKGCYATEVFAFGSVPLKTYVPDGDIDLTVVTHKGMEEDLARDICSILKCDENDAEFQVKDVQYIQAQVKIVKCCVKNISVDISFNQMAGLCALCFLEQVDQLIGKEHLLKRSIILIKAWCFYESRILGAHHGLISTYALEIMVMNIINLFHSSLPGPLAVLHKFLEYYSTFDWDNYCVSINGPTAISSLPEILGPPENQGNELLLSQEFVKNCREIYAIPIKALDNGAHQFPVKFLNVVDPLKDNNNVGRSVNKGNFHRIKCALSFGAGKLGEILALPGEHMGAALEKFFTNTLERNGKGERPDASVPVPAFGTGRSEASGLSGDYETHCCGLVHGQWFHDYTLPVPLQRNPYLPSQIQRESLRGSQFKLSQCREEGFLRNSNRGYDPKRPVFNIYTPQISALTCGIGKMGKSRGTGTYIPNLPMQTQYIYRRQPPFTRMRKLDYSTPSQFVRPSKKIDQVEDPPITGKIRNGIFANLSDDDFATEVEKNIDGNCLDLSLDQFPLLSSIKKSVTSELRSSDQSVRKVEDWFAPLQRIEFGSFSPFPSEAVASAIARKQEELGIAMDLETVAAEQEMGVFRQQFQLKNDEDFPTLCPSGHY